MSSISNHYIKYAARIETINELAAVDPCRMIADVEKSYRGAVQAIAEEIRQGGYKMVMLAGPSSSGKTTTSHILMESLKKMGVDAQIISLDDFFLGAGKAPVLANGRHDYESLEALDLPRMTCCLSDLMRSNRCEMPVYNFENGRPESFTRPVVMGERDVVIIEGIHALNPYVSRSLPQDKLLKLYISVKQGISDEGGEIISARELRFIRRMVRDYNFRASSPENTLVMWQDVCRGEDIYIQPYKRGADITINSIHLYEPCVFREYAIPLLEQIREEHPRYAAIAHLKDALGRFTPLPAGLIPDHSMLREFIKF